jgi:hypothetical protein
MPKKISGARRKELNSSRAADAASGRAEGTLFGRVIKLLGNGQVHIMIPTSKHGSKTLLVRLPRLFAKKGSTPLSNASVVSFFAGTEFDPDKELTGGDAVVTKYMFDITSILDDKLAQSLFKEGIIPEWMIRSDASDTSKSKEEEAYLFTEDVDEEEEVKKEEEIPKDAPKGISGREKADPLTSRLMHVESDHVFSFE